VFELSISAAPVNASATTTASRHIIICARNAEVRGYCSLATYSDLPGHSRWPINTLRQSGKALTESRVPCILQQIEGATKVR
jgi:hypothetical protein